jgi:hypothetical protein
MFVSHSLDVLCLGRTIGGSPLTVCVVVSPCTVSYTCVSRRGQR